MLMYRGFEKVDYGRHGYAFVNFGLFNDVVLTAYVHNFELSDDYK